MATRPKSNQEKHLPKSTTVDSRVALWELRRRLDVTQKEFAEKLGIGLRSLTRYEKEGDPLPPRVAGKAALLARQAGHNDLSDAFGITLHHAVEGHMHIHSAGSLSAISLIMPRHKAATLLDSFLEFWQVFQPTLSPAEKRIRERMEEILMELSAEIAPKENK
jgi:transcriptional regulator with XRE-family HTH domain